MSPVTRPPGGYGGKALTDHQRQVRRRRQVTADGMLNDALASSQFAISGKLTEQDAIVLTGRASTPSVLLVDGGTPRLIAAGDTWGRPAAEAEEVLKRRLGRGWRIAAPVIAADHDACILCDHCTRALRHSDPNRGPEPVSDRHSDPNCGANPATV